jgi:hypothetical protein
MQISQVELNRYRNQIKQRQNDARDYLLARLEREAHGLSVADARDKTIEIMQDSMGVFGDQAQALSAEFFDEICEAENIDAQPGVMFDDIIDPDKLSEKVHYYAGKLVNGDWDGYAGSNADLAAFYVHRSALQNMERNCYQNHVRYARVGTGRETCGFCFMLCTRGFDYRSEETASAASHPHCDCIIVPGVDGVTKIEGYEPDKMRHRWNDCKDAIGGDKGIRSDFDALSKKEMSKIKGRNAEEKWLRFRNYEVNKQVEKNDSLYMYRGIKLKGRLKVTGNMSDDDARAYVKSDTQSKHVLKNKQDSHRGKAAEDSDKSIVSISDDEIEELVSKYAGTGRFHINNQPDGTPQIKEVITVPNGKIIGKDTNPKTYVVRGTDSFTVHYSDGGIHVVPANPSKMLMGGK